MKGVQQASSQLFLLRATIDALEVIYWSQYFLQVQHKIR